MSEANLIERKVRRPRVTKEYRNDDCFNGRYKQHDIAIERVGGNRNWYIRVRSPSGIYAYDGYWTDSAHRSLDDAITEACAGACLWLPNTKIANA
jgi:hypothetical protein